MSKLGLVVIILMCLSVVALADGTPNSEPCSHPRFMTHDCNITDGVDGQDGQDGEDGQDGDTGPAGPRGIQGEQGIQGIQGEQGVQGAQGPAGVAPRLWYDELRNFIAAEGAAQTYLPDDQDNRLTFSINRVDARNAVGIGYARRIDEDAAFTIAIGRAGDQVVGKAAITMEF